MGLPLAKEGEKSCTSNFLFLWTRAKLLSLLYTNKSIRESETSLKVKLELIEKAIFNCAVFSQFIHAYCKCQLPPSSLSSLQLYSK